MDTSIWLGIAVVFATLTGPVLAVLVTRTIDDQRSRKTRQMEVFRALMRSRRSALSPEYVTAFNTIEVEFAGVAAIENAQREMLQHLSTPAQPGDWFDRLRRLQTRLLYAIATHLGYKMQQLDVLEGGYLPQGWGTAEEEQAALRKALLDLLASKRPLPVQVTNPASPAGPPMTPPATGQVNALFLVEYSGQSGASGNGMLQLSNGAIMGGDVVGGHYEGTYTIENGRLRGAVKMRVPGGTTLVTGYTPATEVSVPIEFNMEYTPNAPMRQTVSVGGEPVQIVLSKLRDLSAP